MNFDDLSTKWQAERIFWTGRNVETFDLVFVYQGYAGDNQMEKQYGDTYQGEWVRSEDYMRDVARLEQRIKELEAK